MIVALMMVYILLWTSKLALITKIGVTIGMSMELYAEIRFNIKKNKDLTKLPEPKSRVSDLTPILIGKPGKG